MRRSVLSAIMVIGAVILAGTFIVRAQQEPLEAVPATSTSATSPTSDSMEQDTTTHDATTQGQPAEVAGGTQPEPEMPQTASPLPLIALAGALSAGASLGLKAWSRITDGAAGTQAR